MALYQSAYSAFRVSVRGESIQYHPATGVEIGRVKGLAAEFGEHGGTFTSESPLSGQLEEHAMIYGHYFDSEAAQEKLGWTDEERESVEYAIEKIAMEQPYLVRKVEYEIPASPMPWPTYDAMNAKEVVQFAQGTGLVAEAMSYERENKNRVTLLAELEELLGDDQPDPAGSPVAPQAEITL